MPPRDPASRIPFRSVSLTWLAFAIAATLPWLMTAPCGAQDAPPASPVSPRPDSMLSAPARDSAAVPAPDSLRAHRGQSSLGVADTVTMLPPVRVEGRPGGLVPDRTTATRVFLNRGEATRFLPGTSGDALLAVPGVDLVKTGPWASRITFRGFSGDRVLVLVDGVRVNTVRGHGAQASLVPLDQLEAAELLPGATSAQFGSDALGGVINLVTHRDLYAPERNLGLTLMAHGAGPGGAWGQSFRTQYRTPHWGLELSGGLAALDALVTPGGRIPDSGDREDHLGGRMVARAGGIEFDLEQSRLAAHDVGLPAFANASGASGTYPLQARAMTRFEASWAGHGIWPIARVLAVRQRFETRFTEITVDSAFVRGHFVGTVTNDAADRVVSPAYSVAPELRFQGFGNLRLMGEWRREQTSGPRETRETVRNAAGDVASETPSSGESIPPARRDAWALGTFLSQPAAGFRFEAGARWDALRSRADSTANSSTSRLDVTDRRTSLEAGVSRRLGPVESYGHVSTGFRAPNLQERYYNDEVHGGLRLFGNPDLETERSESFEAGVRTDEAWGGRVRAFRLSAYRANVRDMITLVYLGQLYLVPRFQYANVSRARIEGVELAGQLRLAGVQIGLGVAVPRGVDVTTGDRLLDAGSARATLDLSVPLGRVLPYGRLATRVRWSNAITGVDSTFARPSFATVAIEASTVIAGTRAVVAVRNLLAEHYLEPLSFIPEPGRTFAVSLRRDFDLGVGRRRSEP